MTKKLAVIPKGKTAVTQTKNSGLSLTTRIEKLDIKSRGVMALEVATAATQGSQCSLIVKEHGEIVMVALIIKLMNECIKLIPSSLNPGEMKSVSQMLIRKYWHWKINEFVILFRDMTTQSFGKDGRIFGQLSAKDIFTCADLHEKRRWMVIEQQRELKHHDVKFVKPLTDWNPKVLERMRLAAEETAKEMEADKRRKKNLPGSLSTFLRDLMPADTKTFNRKALKK